MKYSWGDCVEGICTAKTYWGQFNAEKPELGEVYVILPNTWQQCIVKVLYVDDKVALSEEIGGLSVGRRWMHNSTGLAQGHKYKDGRECYRLQSIDVIKKKACN